MSFDWLTFFTRYGVEHHQQRRDWYAIWCPYCGGPGTHHMGVNLVTGGYHCWHGHSGLSATRLVAALLGCSSYEAARIVGSQDTSFATSDGSFADDCFRRLGQVLERPRFADGPLLPLPEFVSITNAGASQRLALPYLASRGYGLDGALALADRYGLMFAARGPFSYRIIVPIVRGRRLVNWTGRTVAASDKLRYKSLTTNAAKAEAQDLPPALVNIKEALFDIDEVSRGGEMLVLTEGPFDAMRVGFFGEPYGIRATCFFGLEVSTKQLDLLYPLLPRYDRVVSLLDSDAEFDSFARISDEFGVSGIRLPAGVKDPAMLTRTQFSGIFLRTGA